MTNTNPLWKTLLLAVVLLVGVLFALPNLFGSDPAVQISARSAELTTEDVSRFSKVLSDAGFTDVEVREEDGRYLALFDNEDDQIRARDVLADKLDPNTYITALNLVDASPAWLRSIAAPMYLGLDLRGGVHFLMEVDMGAAIDTAEERFIPAWKRDVREAGIRRTSIQHTDGVLSARFRDVADRDRMLDKFRDEGGDLDFETSEEGEFAYITANLTEAAAEEEQRAALQQNIVTLRNRINELGVSEPVIQQQGLDRIVVQLPGVQDTARAKEILGATATLEYRLVSTRSDARPYKRREDGSTIMLDRDIIVTGDQIKGASSGIDQQTGTPAVFVNLDNAGARRMQEVTQDNVGNLMAVVYIENRIDNVEINGELVKKVTKVEEVINAATIRDVLSHRFQTTGLGAQEASDLALLLRAGALKAPVQIVEERTVGPSLGRDNIRQGFLSAVAGLAIVVVFMAVYYRVFGIIAGFALITNVVLIVAVLGALTATLTLPGIAGIVLTVGMAVDANVLIFERIREELRSGTAVQAAISAGYDKAFSTIADANVTTLIAAIVLFSLGTGPIKGFAITLCIGILTSMFTAIFGTRVIVNALYGGRRLSALPI
ncbi:MAG: protein translocase subunit SecD [Granulosicoccus sp.]|nr:protein translocase subunit SecD [Granulosicoccus sp.]